MIPSDFQKYLRSDVFKRLLDKFQQCLKDNSVEFFDPDDLLDIAEYYHLKGDVDNALKASEYCLKLFPDNIKAMVFIARTYIQTGDVDRAQQVADEISNDTCVDVLYLRAELLICRNKFDEADDFLQQHFESLHKEVDDIFNESDDEDAEDDCANYPLDVCLLFCDYQVWDKADKWLGLVDDEELKTCGDFLEAKARILTAVAKYKEAISVWNSYIDIDAYSTLAWIQLSQCQYHEGNCSEALQCAEYAEAIDPTLPEVYISEGNCLFAVGKNQEAVDKFKKYLELCPEDMQGELLLASVLFTMEKYDEAYDHICKAYKALPDYDGDETLPNNVRTEVLRQAAYICSALGKLDDALLFADKLLFYGVSEEQHLLLCAGVYLECGETKKAFEMFNQALVKTNHDAATYIKIACMVVDAALYEQGYKLLSEIFKILEDSGAEKGVGYDRYAYAALMTGHYEEFLGALEICSKKMPSETVTIFCTYFPEGMPVSEYLQYARENHIDIGSSLDDKVLE